MIRPSSAAALILSLVSFGSASAAAQGVAPADRPGLLRVTTGSTGELQAWEIQIITLLQSQDLVLTTVQNDSVLPGRHHESLRQMYRGVPVQGGGVTRQVQAGSVVSIIGTIYTDIDLETTPTLSADGAIAALRVRTSAELAFGQTPALLILPKLIQGYSLAYRVTLSDQTTYFVDAHTGSVLQTESARVDQGAVGVGTGALGDVKKISTTQSNGGYRTEDQLRPAGIRTFDTRLSEATLDRLLSQGVALDSDFATDLDNSWTDTRVVDAHVHAGWSHDYFATRHNWRGMDGVGSRVVSIVHRPRTNNAFFIPPPFGPSQAGAIVFGDTTTGRPMSALDTVAHELMHSVTHHALSRRTGQGLGARLYVDRLGPSSFTFAGDTYPCANSVLVYPDGARFPFVCDDGRYVLVSNHPGDINEGFADIFATGAEFFFGHTGQAPDYTMGEDLLGLGPIRRLDAPGALSIATASGQAFYPDHATRRFNYAVVAVEGTPTNPTVVDIAPIAFVGNTVFVMTGDDSGGVHLNSTVLSHAFYLAVEGGRNTTSGLSVQGVGSQNREQIERIFFRAMTELMPGTPNLTMAAAAIRQAGGDLFGGSSPAARVVSDALTAVGLP